MGQFKPMVKMYTDEPSVILKLKKGGKVKSKAAGQADGFKSMAHNTTKMYEDAPAGVAPKKPSMAERRKAMNPNLYAKGGKVAHKQMGGGMPVARGAGQMPPPPVPRTGGPVNPGPMPLPRPMGGNAGPMPMPPVKPRMGTGAGGMTSPNPAMLRQKLAGMKKGGATAAECAKVERQLKRHEAMSAAKAHGKASGGKIDSAETRTTLKNSVKAYAKTKMDTAHKDKSRGSTGGVTEGKPGGYKMGGSIMGNEGPFENTKMVTAGRGKTGGSTGGVRMSNAGGYKHGGKAMKYASGGAIDSKMTRTTVEGGNWENRPANTSKPGKTNTTTGEVKKGNGGGYKKGGSAKKAYATGGQVVDDGKAVKMPRHAISRPVANTTQSGTFKSGGKVEKEEKPNLRLVKTHTGPKGHTAKVYKDRDYGEYRVKFFSPEGKHLTASDHHTDDVSDANDTAMGQVNRGYKRGGKVAKHASGGSQKDDYDPDDFYQEYEDSDGRIRTRPKNINPRYSETAVNKAIASSNRSGRKISGKEAKAIHSLLKGRYADGGKVPSEIADKLKTAENERAYKNFERMEREENEAIRNVIPNAMRRGMDAVKGLFKSSPPEGSVTKTEKSVTVSPAKKRGGSMKC